MEGGDRDVVHHISSVFSVRFIFYLLGEYPPRKMVMIIRYYQHINMCD